MSQTWFTDRKRGKLRVVRRDDGWYVEPSGVAGETKCIFSDLETTVSDADTHSFEVEVTDYFQGTGSSENYLFADIITQNEERTSPDTRKASAVSSSSDHELALSTDSKASRTGDCAPVRGLSSLTGSGEYVTIEAEIHHIEFVAKNKKNTPDVRGVLRQRGSVKRVPFVVGQGVKHPYLEEGTRFRFENVKDHLYRRQNEVQVFIDEETKFTEL
jgi:hypothetical protein